MNKYNGFNWVRWALILGLSALGCWDDKPCDTGQVFKDGACYAAPTGAAGSTSTGGQSATAGAAGNTASESTWGMACTAAENCGGDSPICAPAPLGYCTNINCSPGEDNAGICPAGWTCFPAGGTNPSACLKL